MVVINKLFQGFYTVYRKLFDKLNEEEEMAYRNDPAEDGASFTRYPSFGNSKTPFADNDGFLGYGSYVRDFYAAWTNFSSVKSFRWMDKWRLSEAPNRYVRRAMEKENKKARENARREYNDTVRVNLVTLSVFPDICVNETVHKLKSLARFVRKRDPRYKAFQAEEEKRKEAAAAEQRARIQREREALQAQAAAYQEQEWAKIDNDGLEDLMSSENEEEEQVESSEFYCVVCDKYYKSERQFASHEISRKHVRLAQAMKEEMMADEEAFDFTGSSTTPQEEKQPEDASDVGESNVQTAGKSKKKKNKNKQKMMPRWGLEEEDQEIDDVAALTAALELEQARRRRNKGGNAETIIDEQNTKEPTTTTTTATVEDKGDLSEQDNKPETPAKTKKQKRKEKRKEADNAGVSTTSSRVLCRRKLITNGVLLQHRCNVCGSDFSSRNQLFNHIKETGHALAVPLKQGKSKKR